MCRGGHSRRGRDPHKEKNVDVLERIRTFRLQAALHQRLKENEIWSIFLFSTPKFFRKKLLSRPENSRSSLFSHFENFYVVCALLSFWRLKYKSLVTSYLVSAYHIRSVSKMTKLKKMKLQYVKVFHTLWHWNDINFKNFLPETVDV